MNVPKPRPKRKEQIRKQYPTELDLLTRQELLKKAQVLNIGSANELDRRALICAIAVAEIKEDAPCK